LRPSGVRRIVPERFRGSRTVMRDDDLELLQGTLDVLVLKTLSWGPRHGYAVARWIAETSGEELAIEEGALYTALHRLEKRGWVEAEWGLSENNRKAKFYQLTARGRAQLRAQAARWARYSTAVTRVLGTA
jgi:transcriptional regulator